MATATMATDRLASNSRISADRNDTLRVPMVSRRCAASERRNPSAWARARPNT